MEHLFHARPLGPTGPDKPSDTEGTGPKYTGSSDERGTRTIGVKAKFIPAILPD